MTRHKILFVTHSLGGGGAERVLIDILKHIDKRKFEPALVLFDKKGVNLKDVPVDVVIYDLKASGWPSAFLSIFKLNRIIRQKRPTVIFSSLWRINLICILARLFSFCPNQLITAEHVFLTAYLNYTKNRFVRPLIAYLVRYLYRKSDLIIAITSQIKEGLIRDFGASPEKIRVIYNPVEISRIKSFSREAITHPWFNDSRIPIVIGVGRLNKQKGFSYLIKAFRELKGKIPARLVILGSGSEQANLLRLIRKLSLNQDVALLGFQSNPYKYMKQATVFVLSSLYEGCPMVLLEALGLGKPIVSTSCPSGPEEIIQNGKNGILIPVANEKALAEALFSVLKNKELRKSLSIEAARRSGDFSIDKIRREYESAIESVLPKNVA